ncbi:MAG TPA: hypothetical protein DEF47_16265 [Herpetosiphon sp.]|uniref:Uncharacterized protein n=1 Tax=Herpetosiphon aurantiacus (strain ATCC 23779 / DSM 785 / 114-95) TaxID=316274 RepID=A9AZ95_HERA2|nr:hypothetical protein Haur_0993 [Herpetosiphon aurantiacus DSM 785]HBW51450.1 hypothetical protein [Herpetosiphon sp.]
MLRGYFVPSLKPNPLPIKLIAGYQFATALFGCYALFWALQQGSGIVDPLSGGSTGVDLLQHWLQTDHWLALVFIGAIGVAITIHSLLGVGLLKKYPFARNATIWWDWTVIGLAGFSLAQSNWYFWIDAAVIAISYLIIHYLQQPEIMEVFQPEIN